MIINIYDRNINFIGVLEAFDSFQCNIPYQSAGDFKIKCIMNSQALNLLQIGNIVVYKDFAGIIDSIQKTEEVGESSTISASGYNLTGILANRIIWDEHQFLETQAHSILRTLVSYNLIIADSDRVISNFTLGSYPASSKVIDFETEHENLLEACGSIAEMADIGFIVDLDISNKQFIFRVFSGEDKTAGTANQVIIGKAYDNVIQQDYTYSVKKETNAILVKGNPDSENPSVLNWGCVEYTQGKTGWDRREAYFKSNKEGNPEDSNYIKILQTEGQTKLITAVDSFDVDTNLTTLSVGDKVSIIDKEWGIAHSAQITEKQITLQNSIENTVYIFGNDIKKEKK